MFGWDSEPATRDSRRKRWANDGIRRVERAELLERHEAIEVGLPGEVHHRHAAATDLPEDLVAADRLQWRQASLRSPVVLSSEAPRSIAREFTDRQPLLRVKLFVLDTHTIYRRGLVACLDLLEEVESVADAERVRDAWEHPALFEADIVLVDPSLPGGSGLRDRGARDGRRARHRLRLRRRPGRSAFRAAGGRRRATCARTS